MDEGQPQEEHGRANETVVLRDRYELGERIGQGGQGITTRAIDRVSGELVVVKELHLAHLDDWKKLELFEREGEALESLNHPAIPAYVDHFHLDEDTSSRLYLVQEYVDGVDLAEALERGLRLTEDEAIEFIAELLEILVYIHSREPPIIHRDIKLANVMRREDGRLALIDFGAARSLLDGSSEGSTVVGTSGYMPLEQLMGRALPATDLYAVGATAIHVLSHTHPADMDVLEMKLQFRGDVAVSERLQDFLETMIEPHVEDRFQSAEEALDALHSVQAPYVSGKSKPIREAAPLKQAPTAGPSSPRADSIEKWTRSRDGDVLVLRGKISVMSAPMRFIFYVLLAFSSLVLLVCVLIIVFLIFVGLLGGVDKAYVFILLAMLILTGFAGGVAVPTAATLFGFEEFRLTSRAIIHRKGVPWRAREQTFDIGEIRDVELVEPANKLPAAPAGLRIKMEFDEAEFDALDDVKGTRRVADEIKAHVARNRA